MKAGAEMVHVVQPERGIIVRGRRWTSNSAINFVAAPGQSVEQLLLSAIGRMRADGTADAAYCRRMLKYCRCRLNGEDVPRERWAETSPTPTSRLEFLLAPGKGGGKNPLATILQMVVVVVAAIATWYVGGAGGWAAFGGSSLGWGAGAGYLAGAAVLALGSLAVNALFPAAQGSIGSSESDNSKTYSLSGGQNSANPNGYVPLILGTYRVTPPLGAKSWTSYEGNEQFLHMLVVWGHHDLIVKNPLIGDTPLSSYRDVTHVYHQSTTGNDLQLFGKSINEQSIGAALTQSGGAVVRTIGECDELSFDISFSALGEADSTTGAIGWRSVIFYAWCRRTDIANQEWKPIGGGSFGIAGGRLQLWGILLNPSRATLWATREGVIGIGTEGLPAGCIEIWPNKNILLTGCDVTYSDEPNPAWGQSSWPTFTVSSGWYSDEGFIGINGAQTKPLTQSFRTAVPHGTYELMIQRNTPDSDNQYIYDAATWTTARAILNRPVFNSPVPLCVSELRIRATEQLNSYVSNLNAICTSYFPTYNGTAWVWAETNNPASCCVYLLLSRAGLSEPFTDAKIDWASFAEFYQFCESKGFTFNFVCDSETNVWQRLTQIASAGRGAITVDNDGKFGVIIDRAGKTPVQLFTPRNSWGFSIKRTFTKLPHALRVKFRDASNNYAEANGFVYADGYDASNATNIVEWEAVGKTNWAEAWRMGRYYLASAKLRPVSLTLSTDWEWRLCRRGDLVGVAHDVLMNTFGTARVQRLIYRVEGEIVYAGNEAELSAIPEGTLPIGVQLDDSVVFSEPSPARYGICIRKTNGQLLTYEISPRYGEEASDLYFVYGITAAQVPTLHALASVSILGDEYAEYLVAGIAPGDNMSADLTLVPYAPEIMDADSGSVPAWSPAIRLDVVPSRDNLPAPFIKEIRSDESVLLRSGDSLLSQIAVWWMPGSSPDPALGAISVQLSAVSAHGENLQASSSIDEPYVAIPGVQDGETYTVRLRLVSPSTGKTSPWSVPQSVTVVGKTTAPKQVTGVSASAEKPAWVAVSWAANAEPDIDYYAVSLDGTVAWTGKETLAKIPAPQRSGDLAVSVAAVDVLGLRGDAETATLAVSMPSVPVLAHETRADGLYLTWQNCETTWGISHYLVTDVWANATSRIDAMQTPILPRAGGDYAFNVVSVDAAGIVSGVGTYTIHISKPETPVVSASVENNALRFSWPAVASTFPVATYEIYSVGGTPIQKTASTYFDVLAPSGTVEYRIRAVDTAGNAGDFAELSYTLMPPEAPTVSVSISVDRRQVEVHWTKNAFTLPVVAYDVVRQYSVTMDGGVREDREEDYGRFDVDYMTVLPLSAGVVDAAHEFMVRAVDSAGNLSSWGNAVLTVNAPRSVPSLTSQVLDNNVLLYWGEPEITSFAIREYQFLEVDFGYEMLLGTIDARFASQWKDKSGSYTFRVRAVDLAGNVGPASDVTTYIDEPPDFQLYHDYDSLFNGALTNFAMDGQGGMVGPINVNETWQENSGRVAGLLSVAEPTWAQKTGAGYELFNSPRLESATYVETVDVGTVIPSTRILVNITKQALDGTPVVSCKIETSEDGTQWKTVAANATITYATSFRYVRYTIAVTGGTIAISGINYRLSVKKKTDFGTGHYDATLGTAGVPVSFNVDFVDVNGTPAVTVTGNRPAGTGNYPYTAFVNFTDLENPAGFDVFILDKNGLPVSADFSWQAFGV